MRDTSKGFIVKILGGTALVFGAAMLVAPLVIDHSGSAAWAQTEGGQGNGQGGEGEGGQGQGGEGGEGQGGPGDDAEGEGPKAGSGGDQGGKPVWAEGGIPEIELGRLNVARSPEKVLDQAYDEALATLTPEMIEFYNLSVDEMIEKLKNEFDSLSYIDSPLQNLALLKEALDGTSALESLGVTENDADTLMAVFLAVAADKEGDGITADTVTAVTTILGTPITGDAAIALAAEAESIRDALVIGHG